MCVWRGGGANLCENRYRHICDDNQCMTMTKMRQLCVSCSRVTICAYIIWHKIGASSRRNGLVHCKKRQGTVEAVQRKVISKKQHNNLTSYSRLPYVFDFTPDPFKSSWLIGDIFQYSNVWIVLETFTILTLFRWVLGLSDLHIFLRFDPK